MAPLQQQSYLDYSMSITTAIKLDQTEEEKKMKTNQELQTINLQIL